MLDDTSKEINWNLMHLLEKARRCLLNFLTCPYRDHYFEDGTYSGDVLLISGIVTHHFLFFLSFSFFSFGGHAITNMNKQLIWPSESTIRLHCRLISPLHHSHQYNKCLKQRILLLSVTLISGGVSSFKGVR